MSNNKLFNEFIELQNTKLVVKLVKRSTETKQIALQNYNMKVFKVQGSVNL